MSNQNTMEFKMRFYKITKHKASFIENMDRIGKLYLPLALLKKMNISDEIVVQIAPDKNNFSTGAIGYVTSFFIEKETKKKVRFKENISEKGELNLIYISKEILENMGLWNEIAVRVVPPGDIGGATVAR